MTKVYINQQQVFPKENTSLKLTIENTFFEDAGSYTLDVVFPLGIPQNLKVFGPLHRIDVSKHAQTYDAVIMVGASVVFKGTAKITSVTEAEVKLQMLGGNSKVKFWAKAEKMYIDELHYEYTDTIRSFDGFCSLEYFGTPLIKAGTFPGKKGVYCYVPILDENGSKPSENNYKGLWNEHKMYIETADQLALYHNETLTNPQFYFEVSRDCICPNLMFVLKWIIGHMGYSVGRNDFDNDFVNGIYIATATRTTDGRPHNEDNSADAMAMAKALPHWTVEEFLRQVEQLLNATVVFDDVRGIADITASAYTDGMVDITDCIVDEYETEVIDDEDVKSNLYDSNVKYKEGESAYHNVDMVDRETIAAFRQVECSLAEARQQWDTIEDDAKKTTVWNTPSGQYCAKVSVNEGLETLELIRFNHFGAIIRNKSNDSDVELKISPVATSMDIDMPVFEYQTASGQVYRGENRWVVKQTVLCLQNQYTPANKASVWDALNGAMDEGKEKEDIMQVFLMDGQQLLSRFYNIIPFQPPFTHHDMNNPSAQSNHASWSMALANDDSIYNIGRLHQSARMQNRNTEHRIKFVVERIPPVYAVFLVRNKKYACKKLEVHFNSEGMDKLVSGYFEEIL